MVKVRLQGKEEEIIEIIEFIKNAKGIEILEQSSPYQNRNSQYVRVYLDLEKKK